jgi:hypothetical protein
MDDDPLMPVKRTVNDANDATSSAFLLILILKLISTLMLLLFSDSATPDATAIADSLSC